MLSFSATLLSYNISLSVRSNNFSKDFLLPNAFFIAKHSSKVIGYLQDSFESKWKTITT